ncbi:MAG: glycosyltransferase family 2 protein [Pedobacter sp.]|nr:MAG: glycosyltransferase family 2 protein [Pedobacter sp.]
MISNNFVGISVIIPVYNGAKYVEKTINSLLSQTFRNFEIICVDDGSTDHSISILENLSRKDDRIKILTKSNSGNVAKVLNFGLGYASGKYFMYSSQDDIFSVDLLENNFDQAEKNNADGVIPRMVPYHKEEDLTDILIPADVNITLTGYEAFLLSLDWQIHGFVLWKISLLRDIGFFEFGLNSDEYTVRMLFYNSEKIVFSNGIFFYRQNNPNAITKKWNLSLIDYIETNLRLEQFLIEKKVDSVYVKKIYKAILHDLLRIQLILYSAKDKLPYNEYNQGLHLLKEKYNAHKIKFNLLN